MYKRSPLLSSGKEDLSNYIEGYDIYNSLLVNILSDTTLPREIYEITVFQYRPDLIARDYYGTTDYTGLLILQCGSMDNYVRGNKLRLIPKPILDGILSSIK